jgi:CelD/BcsL family acetyltransferase involved in cellulose biosynthesis
MSPLFITAHSGQDAFDDIAADWRALLKRLPFDTLFYTPEWQQLTWSEFGQGELQLLALRDESFALIGIAPLALHDGVLSFACYKEISDYLDLLVERGREAEAHQALVAWLLSPHAPAWRTLNLTNIPAASASFGSFADALRAAGLTVETPPEDVCPVITLPENFDAYLDALDGKERRELQRKLRRAAAESRVVFADNAATLAQDTADFVALMKASMATKSDFMTPRMEAFFARLTRAMADAGWLQLSFLEVGDEAPLTRAAAYLNFVYNNNVLVYNSGLDPDKFAHISPGQVLIAKLIEHAIGEKRSTFDFLQGNESYKYKLGAKDVPLQSLVATRL